METFTNLFAKLFQTAVGRVLAAFGVSFVTITSYQEGLDWVKNGVAGMLNSVPADFMMLLAKSGITDGLGYFIGAWTFIVSKAVINRLSFGVFS